MFRRTLLLFLVLSLLTVAAVADPLADFNRQWEMTDDKSDRISLVRESISGTDDLDAIRGMQDTWEEFDKASALEFFQARMDADPSARNIYLYGRLQDPADAITYARKAIEADPSFTYGYRLLIVPYMTVLFRGDDSKPGYAEMQASYPADYELLLANLNYLKDDPDGLGLVYEAQAYQKDYKGQLEILEMARAQGADWANGDRMARAYAGLGQYEKAREAVKQYVQGRLDAGKLEPEDVPEMVVDRYIGALAAVEAYDEGIRYLKSIKDPDLLPLAQYYLAQGYLEMNEPGKAMDALQTMADMGWDETMRLEENPVFEPLHEKDAWATVVKQVHANREASTDERRAEALAERLAIPAPELPLVDVDGNELMLADLRGKVVIIDFWATWCGPCRMAMPEIHKFTEAAGEKIEVISLNVWENAPEKAEQYMKDNGYAMRLMWTRGDVQATDLFEVTGIPTLVVIDPEGTIRFKEVGFSEGLREKLGWFANDLLAAESGRAALPGSN